MFGRGLGGVVAALSLAAVSLTLTGCDLAGTIDVRSEQEIVVNLLVSDAAQACVALTNQSLATLNVQVDLGGCRVTGTLGREDLAGGLVSIAVVGEHYVLDLDLPDDARDLPMDLTVTFPGQVTDGGGGRTDYNSVHFERGWGLGAVGKTRIVALNHPGPPWWVLAAGAGVLVGALATLVLFLLLRRRRTPRAQGADEGTVLAPIGDGAARAEESDRAVALPTDLVDTIMPTPQETASQEGTPSPTVPIGDPSVPSAEPVDHSIWARPEPE